ncbi:MAG: GNAT family N-acetyltransferase [Acholeplasmataceae bacterium]|nr:GNAT family N-acetyltransferase [Acholeplasmataceae bacterium]
MYKLVKPTLAYKEKYLAYIKDWGDQSMTPLTSDIKDMSYEDLLSYFYQAEHDINLPRGYVPDSNYFFVNNRDEILGFVNIRHYLNDILFKIRGHIAYGIRPSKRGLGLSKKMLKLALAKAKEKGINRVLMVCDKSNIASAKAIIANKGILENEVYDVTDHEIIQRYWIDLSGA